MHTLCSISTAIGFIFIGIVLLALMVLVFWMGYVIPVTVSFTWFWYKTMVRLGNGYLNSIGNVMRRLPGIYMSYLTGCGHTSAVSEDGVTWEW